MNCVRNRYQEDTCDLHQFVCKKNHVTTDYIMMNNNCVMNDYDNVCPYKVNSILAKSAKFIFQQIGHKLAGVCQQCLPTRGHPLSNIALKIMQYRAIAPLAMVTL